MGWHHVKTQITQYAWTPRTTAPAWDPFSCKSLQRVTLAPTRGRFWKELHFFLTLIQFLVKVSPEHNVLLPGQLRFICDTGGHRENLTLSVNQNNDSGNVNVIGLESKCQVPYLSLTSIFHVQSSSASSHKIEKSLSIFWRLIQRKCHLVLGWAPERYVQWE